MRLKTDEIDNIKNTITKYFGESQIYLFGSRLNDEVRGGDVDIFVVAQNTEELDKKSAKAQFLLENSLMKPVDILVHRDFGREIERQALSGVKI